MMNIRSRAAAASVWATKKINFSTVFAGQAVGIREVHDDIWLVSFIDYDQDTSILRLGATQEGPPESCPGR